MRHLFPFPLLVAVLGLLAALAARPAAAQTNFAVLTPDGAWTWFNDPRAIWHNGLLYFGYVRAADGKTALSVFDPATGRTTYLWNSGFTQRNDHNNPGLLALADGRLLAIYSRHLTDQYFSFRTSATTNPSTPADWNAEANIPDSGDRMTYANPIQLTAETNLVFNFCRNLNFNPTLYTSTDNGASWSAPRIFIRAGGGGVRPYVKFASDGVRRIDFLYTDGHPRDVPNSLYHFFYQDGAIHRTDGSFLRSFSDLPVLHDAGERGSVIYQYSDAPQSDPNQWIPGGRAWCWEIATDSNGAPVAVFTVQLDNVTGAGWNHDRIYYYYARWTGTNWQKRFIAHAGRPLYPAEDDYAGGIALDPVNPNVVFISSNAQNPFDLATLTNVPLRAAERYELWRGVTGDGGLTFTWTQITSNSPVDNLRPYVPRRNGGEPSVLWFRGTYTTFTSYSTAIAGLFTTRVPPSTNASGVWIHDGDGLWSDPARWQDGLPANGAGQTADFSALDIAADRAVTLDTSRTVGTLRFGDASGSQNWTLAADNNSRLTLAGAPGIHVLRNAATLALPLDGADGFTKHGPGTLVLAASNALRGTLYLDSGGATANDGAVRLAHPGALAAVASPLYLRNTTGPAATGTLELDGVNGSIVVTQECVFSCRNNATVPTVRALNGAHTLAGAQWIQVGGTNVIYQADAGARLAITAPLQYIGALTAARFFTFTGAGDILVSGPIRDSTNGAPIGLFKSGSGTLTLAATNTFTNSATVAAGALRVDGGLTAAPVVVRSGATLAGRGFLAGPVTVQTGGALAPGADAAGWLAISNALNLQAGTVTLLALRPAAGTNAALRVAGLFTRGGALVFTNAGGAFAAGMSFRVFQFGTLAGAFASITLPPLPGALVWNTNQIWTAGVLAVEAAPAPHLNYRWNGGAVEFAWSGPFRLQYQPASRAAGLAPDGWLDAPGGGGSATASINRMVESVFFRLVSCP